MEATRSASVGLACTDQHQYLTFRLGQEQYGVDILRVQEIKGYTAPTQIPNTPSHIKGVMNLRGTVVPVLDLRIKFGMPQADYDGFTVVIVVNVAGRVVGLIVDAVSDVLNVDPGEVVSAPEMGVGVDTSFLQGLAKSSDRLIALLALERVVGNCELEAVTA